MNFGGEVEERLIFISTGQIVELLSVALRIVLAVWSRVGLVFFLSFSLVLCEVNSIIVGIGVVSIDVRLV